MLDALCVAICAATRQAMVLPTDIYGSIVPPRYFIETQRLWLRLLVSEIQEKKARVSHGQKTPVEPELARPQTIPEDKVFCFISRVMAT